MVSTSWMKDGKDTTMDDSKKEFWKLLNLFWLWHPRCHNCKHSDKTDLRICAIIAEKGKDTKCDVGRNFWHVYWKALVKDSSPIEVTHSHWEWIKNG